MSRRSGSYAHRFQQWQFWVIILAILFDLLAFAIPIFALAVLLVLLQPDGWRWLAQLTEMIRQIQEG